MRLFSFGKRKEEEKRVSGCCGDGAPETDSGCCCCGASGGNLCCADADSDVFSIKVLGAGCKACHEQYENAKAAVRAMKLPVEVEYITDMEKVMGYGAMSMPAIVVNEKVVSMGRVLRAADVEKLLNGLGY